tara:strand:- start:169 stop:987 length:819 start_codon:yes stop_codon:yes gene_type:complete
MSDAAQLKGNLAVKNKILSGEVFSAGKLGMSEFLGVQAKLAQVPFPPHIRQLLTVNAGVFPDQTDVLNSFLHLYIESTSSLDILASWIDRDEEFVSLGNSNFSTCPMRSLEPYYFEEGWSTALEGKSVTVVTPFDKSVLSQYGRRDKVWGSKNTLPAFNLSVVKSPFHSMRKSEYSDWFEALDDLYNKCVNFDPDIVIVGAGAFALPLIHKLKTKGISGIHMGGGTQILFGIKGARWDHHEDISKFINDSWIRPSKEETPENQSLVENGCYW